MPQAEKVALRIPLVSIEARCQTLPSSRAHNVLFMYHTLEVHRDYFVTTITGELTFSVASTNPATNNRSLQLRPSKYETSFWVPSEYLPFCGTGRDVTDLACQFDIRYTFKRDNEHYRPHRLLEHGNSCWQHESISIQLRQLYALSKCHKPELDSGRSWQG
jgi:hypothetical protein